MERFRHERVVADLEPRCWRGSGHSGADARCGASATADAGASQRNPRLLPLRFHGELLRRSAGRPRCSAMPGTQHRQALAGLQNGRQRGNAGARRACGRCSAARKIRTLVAAGCCAGRGCAIQTGRATCGNKAGRAEDQTPRQAGSVVKNHSRASAYRIADRGYPAVLPFRFHGALPRRDAGRQGRTALPAAQCRPLVSWLQSGGGSNDAAPSRSRAIACCRGRTGSATGHTGRRTAACALVHHAAKTPGHRRHLPRRRSKTVCRRPARRRTHSQMSWRERSETYPAMLRRSRSGQCEVSRSAVPA